MNTVKLVRFEDSEGYSRFWRYYLHGLPGPGLKVDYKLYDTWGDLVARDEHKQWYFAFRDIEQAAKYMNVEAAREEGDLQEIEVERDKVIFTSTQCIYHKNGRVR